MYQLAVRMEVGAWEWSQFQPVAMSGSVAFVSLPNPQGNGAVFVVFRPMSSSTSLEVVKQTAG